ncbi:hypothetical protein AWC38_SpisGene1419 [Stylophora pistillata]|uniref:Uncharacterized protein n=1 Tax=Stylophora pistillata TaxID=50429 RepID=A0A2B4SYU9_STYPI|nr:hypothetical protein AWC38_SpisGene1419 [Stylophora pistillata]
MEEGTQVRAILLREAVPTRDTIVPAVPGVLVLSERSKKQRLPAVKSETEEEEQGEEQGEDEGQDRAENQREKQTAGIVSSEKQQYYTLSSAGTDTETEEMKAL